MQEVKGMKTRLNETYCVEMFMEVLLDYIRNYTGMEFSSNERAKIIQNFKYRVAERKQYLLREGDVCQHVIFVVSGALRMFSVNERGNESIVAFHIENSWAMDRESIGLQQSSRYNIQALEHSHTLQISPSQLHSLSINIPAIREMLRRQNVENAIAIQKRIHAAISLGAEERYYDMKVSNPNYEQRFSQSMLASYLGMKAETLSRLRRRG